MRVRIGDGEVFELDVPPGDPVQLTYEQGRLWATMLRTRADDEYVRRRETALRCAAGRCGLPGQHSLNYPCAGTD